MKQRFKIIPVVAFLIMLIGGSALGQGDTAPVNILGLVPLTGPYAADGELLRRGHELAIEHFGGTVLDRPIEYILRDSQSDVGVSVRRVTEALDAQDVTAIVGPWADNVGQAIADLARQREVVHYWSGGPIECNAYAFEWAPSYYSAVWGVMDYINNENPDAKRWYLLTADYSFGDTLETLEQAIAEEQGIEIVGSSRHVLGERQFSRYMPEIAALAPDVLVLNNFGLDTAQAIREAASFGLHQSTQIVVPWGSGIEDYLRLDPEITQGMIIGTAFYYTVDTPEAQKFTEDYIDRYGEPPGYPAGSAYSAMLTILQGIERAGSSEPAALVEAMEGWKFNGLLGEMTIDANTHKTIRPVFITRGKAPADMSNSFDVAELVASITRPAPPEFETCAGITSR